MKAIIDGSFLAYQLYHADNSISCYRFEGVISRVISQICRVSGVKFVQRQDVFVVFDSASGDNWRSDILPCYKHGRGNEKGHSGATTLIEESIDHLRAARWSVRLPPPRHEGDDVIAGLVRKFPDSIIASGDHDLLQLTAICRGVLMLAGKYRGQLVDSEMTRAIYGIGAATLLPLYKAIVGDRSDSIPGVPGYGPKRASEILARPNLNLASLKDIFGGEEMAIIERNIAIIDLLSKKCA